jgi:hypothetical protein
MVRSGNGIGNFPIIVLKKLMKGLQQWEPDSEKRLKHILENMIYVCELQPKNMFIYLQLFDPENKYKMNFYRGSFLDDEFSEVMKEWGVEKFDIVVGNPPYNNSTDKLNRGISTSNLPIDFINKSLNLLKENCFLLFVLPTNNVVKKIYDYEIQYLSTNSYNFFGGDVLAVKTIYFLIKNKKTEKIVQNVNFRIRNEERKITIYKGENFEKDPTFISNNIKKKVIYIKSKKFTFYKNKTYKKIGNSLYDTLDLDGIKLKMVNKDIHELYIGSKFIINFDSRLRYYKDYNGDIKTSLPYYIISNKTQMDNFEFLINSKLIKYLSNNWGTKGFDVGRFFKLVSEIEIPTDYLINDNYIYEKYNLSIDEINFIEEK